MRSPHLHQILALSIDDFWRLEPAHVQHFSSVLCVKWLSERRSVSTNLQAKFLMSAQNFWSGICSSDHHRKPFLISRMVRCPSFIDGYSIWIWRSHSTEAHTVESHDWLSKHSGEFLSWLVVDLYQVAVFIMAWLDHFRADRVCSYEYVWTLMHLLNEDLFRIIMDLRK